MDFHTKNSIQKFPYIVVIFKKRVRNTCIRSKMKFDNHKPSISIQRLLQTLLKHILSEMQENIKFF